MLCVCLLDFGFTDCVGLFGCDLCLFVFVICLVICVASLFDFLDLWLMFRFVC